MSGDENIFFRGKSILLEQGIFGFLSQSIQFLRERTLGSVRIYFALPKLTEAISKVNSFADALELSYSFNVSGIKVRPLQDKEEIAEFFRIIEGTNARVIIEIGPGLGGTLFLFSRVAEENADLVSIDLPSGPFEIGHPSWMDKIFISFRRMNQRMHIVRGNSHDNQTFARTKEILEGRKADILFIDGDHTYEGVKKDFSMYSGLVREGGIVVFHDIVPNAANKGVQVAEFWNEIKGEFPFTEIKRSRDGNGIGILRV